MTLWLVADDVIPNGSFAGNLSLDTDPVTDTKTFQLTIQHTTGWAKLWGVFVIFAGVVLAWLTTAFARSRINRDQALLLVAVLQQKLDALQTGLGSIATTLRGSISQTPVALNSALSDLSEESLDDSQLLPPSLPAISISPTQMGKFDNFLQLKSALADNLNVIVTGLKTAGALAAPSLPAGRLAQLETLIGNIDRLSSSLPQSSDSLRSEIQTLFDTFNAAAQAEAAGAPARLLAVPQSSLNTTHIRLEIQSITLLFWAAWGGLSVTAGFIVLILPSAAFGTIADYLHCLLWGFGLPVAGQGLQTLSQSSVNTQLGVTLPK